LNFLLLVKPTILLPDGINHLYLPVVFNFILLQNYTHDASRTD
jgi:hypothetical protein